MVGRGDPEGLFNQNGSVILFYDSKRFPMLCSVVQALQPLRAGC